MNCWFSIFIILLHNNLCYSNSLWCLCQHSKFLHWKQKTCFYHYQTVRQGKHF